MAIMSGLVFSKFSRPKSRILFSDKAIIAKMDDIPCLMFRLANGRTTSIVEAKIKVVALITYRSKEGLELRRFQDITLDRHFSPLFTLSWLIIHRIDATSPLHNMSMEQIQQSQTAFIVSFTGIDDVYSQHVHDHYTYLCKDIVEAKKFEDMIEVLPDETRLVDYAKFHQIVKR